MKTKPIYHVGFSKRGQTLVIEATRSVDYLSCELYDYMGRRETTKAQLRANRYDILRMMQAQKPEVYRDLKFAVVE